MGDRRGRRREWSRLALDLLGAIFDRLPVPDRLRVRAVCRGWWAASTESTPNYRPTINPQVPWMVGASADVYALSEHRWYRLNNIPIGARCIASSPHGGWLVFAKEPDQLLCVLNPVTGVTIDLPSFATLPPIKHAMQEPNFFRVKVFSEHHRPSLPPTVFVLCSSRDKTDGQNRLAYANAGDHLWTPIVEPHRFTRMADFEYHKGKLYGVFPFCTLMVIDNITSSSNCNWRHIINSTPTTFEEYLTATSTYERLSYHLLNSVDGEDLLLVMRCNPPSPPFYSKSSFWVNKLETRSWSSALPRLEEHTAIFLGGNRSMALSTRALPELKENCIYFTNSTQLNSDHAAAWDDQGIFDLENQTVNPLFPHNYRFTPSLYHWFTPAL